MAQSIKCTVHKHEGLSLDPQHPREQSHASWGDGKEWVRTRTQILGACLVTSEPASKIKVKNNQRRH